MTKGKPDTLRQVISAIMICVGITLAYVLATIAR